MTLNIQLTKPMNNMNYGVEEKREKKPSIFWAIDRAYPHVVTKHDHCFDSTEIIFGESIEDCFEMRRNMSSAYMKIWLSWKEYDKNYAE